MTQAQVDDKRISLSNYTSVTVTENAQIEFTVTPCNDFMAKTFVYLSSPAWASLCNTARNQINKLLDDKEEGTWMYHPNTKFVRVTLTGQVFLQTYNRKGNMMKDHSVFLSNEEWNNLDGNMPQINQMLDEVWSTKKRNNSAKGMMTTYRWKFNGVQGGREHSGFVYYLDRQTAKEAALKYQLNTVEELGTMKIETFVHTQLDPLKFMTVVYFTLMYKTSKFIINCEFDCPVKLDMSNPPEPGPISPKKFKNFVIDNFDMLHEIISDEVVVEVFLECWKRMKLGITDAPAQLKSIHTVLSEKTMIADKVHDQGMSLVSDPQCILVSSVFFEKNMESKIWKHFNPKDEWNPEESKKKAKLEIVSDTESE